MEAAKRAKRLFDWASKQLQVKANDLPSDGVLAHLQDCYEVSRHVLQMQSDLRPKDIVDVKLGTHPVVHFKRGEVIKTFENGTALVSIADMGTPLSCFRHQLEFVEHGTTVEQKQDGKIR